MWFKNIKIFELPKTIPYDAEILEQKLRQLQFQPCTAAMPMSFGFVPPIVNEDSQEAPLVHAVMGQMLFCLNIEDKVLPATVVRQQTLERIKELEQLENRKLSQREKLSIKDQIYFALIQKALCRSSKIYAYFDLQNQWLMVDTINAKKLELFVSTLKKALEPIEFIAPTTKNIPKIMTQWLLSGHYPTVFEIEKQCKLMDFNDKNRVISCRNQDLFNDNIQNLIKEGCIPQQIALSWQERISFNLNDNFTLAALKYADAIIEEAKQDGGETDAERFDADFVIMTQTLQHLFKDLLLHLTEREEGSAESVDIAAVSEAKT